MSFHPSFAFIPRPPPQFQQSLRPQTSPAKRKKPKTWTAEEDQKLTEAVQTHGAENWILVAQCVGGGRTRSQCSQRWLRVINPKLKKLSWTNEEDELLIRAVQAVGTKSWTKVAALVGHRCDVQCRYRYQQLMKKRGQPKYHSLPTHEEMYAMQGFCPAAPLVMPVPMYQEDYRPPCAHCEPVQPQPALPSIWKMLGQDGPQV